MKIGGLQRTSMIDYPGCISCVLFLSKCNFRCPYCYNPVLVKGGSVEDITEEDFFTFLMERKGFLDAVVISGGEPTLNSSLPGLCERVHQLGFLVKLDTNGSRPDMLSLLIENRYVDYVAMDIKTDERGYESLCTERDIYDKVDRSISIIMASCIPYEFRTTCVRPFVDRPVLMHMAKRIKGAKSYYLQHFKRDTDLLDPAFRIKEGALLSEEEMEELLSVARKYVNNSSIR